MLALVLNGWGRFIIIAFKPFFFLHLIPGPYQPDRKQNHISVLTASLHYESLAPQFLTKISDQTEIITRFPQYSCCSQFGPVIFFRKTNLLKSCRCCQRNNSTWFERYREFLHKSSSAYNDKTSWYTYQILVQMKLKTYIWLVYLNNTLVV